MSNNQFNNLVYNRLHAPDFAQPKPLNPLIVIAAIAIPLILITGAKR